MKRWKLCHCPHTTRSDLTRDTIRKSVWIERGYYLLESNWHLRTFYLDKWLLTVAWQSKYLIQSRFLWIKAWICPCREMNTTSFFFYCSVFTYLWGAQWRGNCMFIFMDNTAWPPAGDHFSESNLSKKLSPQDFQSMYSLDYFPRVYRLLAPISLLSKEVELQWVYSVFLYLFCSISSFYNPHHHFISYVYSVP